MDIKLIPQVVKEHALDAGKVLILKYPSELVDQPLFSSFMGIAKLCDKANKEYERREFDDMFNLYSEAITTIITCKAEILKSKDKFKPENLQIILLIAEILLFSAYLNRTIANRQLSDYYGAVNDVQSAKNVTAVMNSLGCGFHRYHLKLLNSEANLSESYAEIKAKFSECIATMRQESNGELVPLFDEFTLRYNPIPTAENLLEVYSSSLEEARLNEKYNVKLQPRGPVPPEGISLKWYALALVVLLGFFVAFYISIEDVVYDA